MHTSYYKVILINSMMKKDAQDMYSYGMLFTTNSELVKDCLHDVFIKIHRNRKKLSQVDNIRLYLLKAMKNYLFNVKDP